jgi:hypothetical protein
VLLFSGSFVQLKCFAAKHHDRAAPPPACDQPMFYAACWPLLFPIDSVHVLDANYRLTTARDAHRLHVEELMTRMQFGWLRPQDLSELQGWGGEARARWEEMKAAPWRFSGADVPLYIVQKNLTADRINGELLDKMHGHLVGRLRVEGKVHMWAVDTRNGAELPRLELGEERPYYEGKACTVLAQGVRVRATSNLPEQDIVTGALADVVSVERGGGDGRFDVVNIRLVTGGRVVRVAYHQWQYVTSHKEVLGRLHIPLELAYA